MFCPIDQETFWQRAGNALGSRDGQRRGNRCRRCANRARGAARRLSEAALDARAVFNGLVRDFAYAAYTNHQTPLPWIVKATGMRVFRAVGKLKVPKG